MFLGRTANDTRATDFHTARYVHARSGKWQRHFPYSTNLNTNPLLFSNMDHREPHRVGEVFASMLNEMYWNLVDKIGFSGDWSDSSQKSGNIIALKLIMGSLLLQPCNPSFTQARDALLHANAINFNEEFSCQIWDAFAKRGFGMNADERTFKNGFRTLNNCHTFPAQNGKCIGCFWR